MVKDFENFCGNDVGYFCNLFRRSPVNKTFTMRQYKGRRQEQIFLNCPTKIFEF